MNDIPKTNAMKRTWEQEGFALSYKITYPFKIVGNFEYVLLLKSLFIFVTVAFGI